MKKLLEKIRIRISVWRRTRALKQEMKNLWKEWKWRGHEINTILVECARNDESLNGQNYERVQYLNRMRERIQNRILEDRQRLAELNKN